MEDHLLLCIWPRDKSKFLTYYMYKKSDSLMIVINEIIDTYLASSLKYQEFK